MLKKVFALGISSALLLTSVSPTFASSLENNGDDVLINKALNELPKKDGSLIKDTFTQLPENITILENNLSKTIVKEVTDNGVTISTNDKLTQILTIDKFEKDGVTLISSTKLDLAEINAQAAEPEISTFAFSGKGDIYQHTFTNREYDIKLNQTNKTREWRLRSGSQTKYVMEIEDVNDDILKDFRKAVNAIDSTEKNIILVGGVAAIAAFLTGGIAAGISAAGGGTLVGGLFIALDGQIDEADYIYRMVPRQR